MWCCTIMITIPGRGAGQGYFYLDYTYLLDPDLIIYYNNIYTIYNYKIIIIGGQGYFYLDYPYLLDPDLASDMWTITKAT